MIFRIAISLLLIFAAKMVNANVLGDMQTFAPNTDGLDFISVHTSRPLTKGFFAVGGHFSYARNHLVVFKDFNSQDRYQYKDSLVEFDVDIAYAISEKFSVYFAAPTLLWQEADGGQDVDVEISKGVHTYRPGFKWTLGEGSSEFAILGSIDILNVTNSPYTGVDSNPIYNLELAKTFKAAGKVAYGLNLGYRFREPTENPIDSNMFPLEDQITFSAGRSAPAFKKGRWVLEAMASFPVDKDPYKDAVDASSLDILLGFKHRLMRNLNFDWGGTIEPFIDTQSPQFRVFVGLVYYFNPGWSSNKNVESVPPPVQASSTAEEKEEPAEKYVPRDEIDPLSVTPELAEVFEGAMVRYRITGGEPPYVLRIIEGAGDLNDVKYYYRAPMKPELAKIEVIDSREQTRIVEVIVKRAPKPNETIRIKNLNFIFDTDILVKSSKAEMRRIIGLFKGKRVSRIIVEGHTDSKGSNEYNLDLSERRAQAVRRALMEGLSLSADQVHAIGFGEERPIATNNTDAGRLANRRVDLKVYYR